MSIIGFLLKSKKKMAKEDTGHVKVGKYTITPHAQNRTSNPTKKDCKKVKYRIGFAKENISDKTLTHASKGEYTKTNRLKSGGHGQEAIDYMTSTGIDYNITKTYKNGVRIGNVPNHDKKIKRSGNNQSWFPSNWDKTTIKKAGQNVARGRKYPNGMIKTGKYKRVKVGIIRTNGEIGTIFPTNKQK